ncbi:hypothetical protein EON80_11175 [bacterium]|nr:MAG: hypothetical protein EON80_11175 [bacterium]
MRRASIGLWSLLSSLLLVTSLGASPQSPHKTSPVPNKRAKPVPQLRVVPRPYQPYDPDRALIEDLQVQVKVLKAQRQALLREFQPGSVEVRNLEKRLLQAEQKLAKLKRSRTAPQGPFRLL